MCDKFNRIWRDLVHIILNNVNCKENVFMLKKLWMNIWGF